MNIFAYGVLLNPKTWNELNIPMVTAGRAKLEEFELCFDGQSKTRGGATANIRPAAGKEVWGCMFRVNNDNLAILDAYEGVPQYYRREEYLVKRVNGATAVAYVYLRSGEELGMPSSSYFDEVRQGAVLQKLPERYVHWLDNFRPSL